MEQQYGDDIITITDEDGVEYELEVLARVTYEDAEYLALTPADAQEAEELENVYNALMDLLYEEDEGLPS